MLFRTAVRIILHEKEKYGGAVAGIALAIFLVILQWGFYLGFQRDITVVLDSVNADIWIIPRNQPLFDGWGLMDDLPCWKAQAHPEVQTATRLVWGYAAWRLPTSGGKDTVEVLGVDFDSGVDLKFKLPAGDLSALLRPAGHVLVGLQDRGKLGLEGSDGDGSEIMGRRATTVGFVPGVRLFTTSGFVLTDLDNARAFLRLPSSHVHYIACRCRPGADLQKVVRELQQAIPDHDVLPAQDFHNRAADYWSTRTSIGPLLGLCTVLAVVVGFLIVVLAFYVSTVEKIPIFACLKALGASNGEIVTILTYQVVIAYILGAAGAGAGLSIAAELLANTKISLVITPQLVFVGLGLTALCSATSALLSIRRLVQADPGEAFRS